MAGASTATTPPPTPYIQTPTGAHHPNLHTSPARVHHDGELPSHIPVDCKFTQKVVNSAIVNLQLQNLTLQTGVEIVNLQSQNW